MTKISLVIITLGMLACASSSNAALITQQKDFDYSDGPISGTGTVNLVNGGDLVAEVLSFDTSLGTLNSFSVDWFLKFEAEGIAGPLMNASTSSLYSFAGGTLNLAGMIYNGTGSGDDTISANEGDVINIGYTLSHVELFDVADAGISYNPYILATVLGGTTFDLLYDTNFEVDFNNIIDLNASITGRVIFTYDYTPNATNVSSPATLAIFGFALAGLGWSRRK